MTSSISTSESSCVAGITHNATRCYVEFRPDGSIYLTVSRQRRSCTVRVSPETQPFDISTEWNQP